MALSRRRETGRRKVDQPFEPSEQAVIQQALGGLLRHILTATGAVGAAQAETSSGHLAGALLFFAGVVWSFYQKKHKK